MPEAAFAPVRPVFRAFVSTIVPEASALDERQWAELEALVETVLRDRPVPLKRQLRAALRFIQWAPLLRYGARFTALPPARRTHILSCLENNRVELVRLGFWGLRTMALVGYYGRAEGIRATGWAADPRGWEAAR